MAEMTDKMAVETDKKRKNPRLTSGPKVGSPGEAVGIPNITEMLPFFDLEDLPFKKRKILAVSALPQCVNWSATDKAALAGVHRTYWFRCFADEKFQQASVEIAKRLLSSHVFDTLNAFIETAKKGNIVAQQAILRQLGVLDKSNGNGSGAGVTVNIAIIQQEREERLGKSLGRFGYEVAAEPEDGN